MFGFISKIFGGNKSERDVKVTMPYVAKINDFFAHYQSFSNDELRANSAIFRQRIATALAEIDGEIAERKAAAEATNRGAQGGADKSFRHGDVS